MTVNVFLDPTAMPSRSMDQQTFDNAMAALMQNLPVLASQINATEASMGIAAAGGANKIAYKVDLGTTMADPTAGWLRLNNTTQNLATAIVVDVISSDNGGYTELLNTFDDSTSSVLGQIRIEKMGDATKFLVFNLTAMTTPSGYRQFTVACVGFSAASPFIQGDQVALSFQRNGDKGDQASGFSNMVVMSSTGTWTPPAGISKAEITVIDGGASSSTFAAGGVGGSASISIRAVAPSVTYTCTVGAGGVGGGASSNVASSPGGASSFSGSGFTTLTTSNGDLKAVGGTPAAAGAGAAGGGSLYSPPRTGVPAGYGGGGGSPNVGDVAYGGKAGAIIIRY
jgi:hypothetical protein